MTPCERRGYKVGDLFRVEIEDIFTRGSIIMLVADDGSTTPRFKLLFGSLSSPELWLTYDPDYLYERIGNIDPLPRQE